MATSEILDIDQILNEEAENDSGIQISQHDEEEKEEEIANIDAETEAYSDHVESELPKEHEPEPSTEKENTTPNESTEEPAPESINTEEYPAAIELKEEYIIVDPIKAEYTISDSPHEDYQEKSQSEVDDKKAEENAEEEKNGPSENDKLVTVELTVNETDKISPEIVVEPKFPELLPNEKIIPQSLTVLTPKYYSLPQLRGQTPPTFPTESNKQSFCKKFKRCCILLLFTAIVVGYAIGGAYLFSYLERAREIEYSSHIDKWKNDTAILLATELRQVLPYEEIWARKVFQYLENYEKDLLKASAFGYRRHDDKDREQRWTWRSSLFFSVTLMTTTGYGPMTPRSKLGRIAALFYSMFGIPLTISWFVIIGNTLARLWASLFQNVCCRLCHDIPPENLRDLIPTAKSFKLPKPRSNSVVPVEEQKLIDRTDSNLCDSQKNRASMFPLNNKSKNETIATSNQYTKPNKNFRNSIQSMHKCQLQFADVQNMYQKMDYCMAIVYACLFFVVYYLFFSILFALYEGWVLTDIMYFSYLMFVTVGPGCHEMADDGAEIKIKNDLIYTIHLCIGYCLLAMILNLFYMLFQGKYNADERTQKWEVFDSLQQEKF